VKQTSSFKANLASTFSALKYRNFRFFWFGQCVSLVGTWMQRAAQTWLVLQLTNSAFLVGLLGVFQFLPQLMFALFTGVITDRYPKKNLLLLTQWLFTLQAAVMTVLTFLKVIQYWHVLVLIFFFGVTQSLDMPVRQSFFYELVGKDDIMNAVSLNSTIVNLARIFGPMLAGFVMVRYGAVMCFFINVISYLAVIGGIMMIKVEPKKTPPRKNMFTEAKGGLQFIGKSEILILGVLFAGIVSTTLFNTDVVSPVFARAVFGEDSKNYTSLLSAIGFGAFIGAVFMAYVSKHGLKKHNLIYGGTAMSLLMMATVLTKQIAVCRVLLAAFGFFQIVFMNTTNALFQMNSPDEYRGRVMSVYAFIQQGSHPLGNLLVGTGMQFLGGGLGFFLCGTGALLGLMPVFLIKRKTLSGWLAERRRDKVPAQP
jgi:MFS family permease